MLDDNITSRDVWFARVGDNLDVSVFGRDEHYVVADWFVSNTGQAKTDFVLADGTTLLATDVTKLVSAMAAFTVPTATQTELTTGQHLALDGVIATSWSMK